MPTRIQSRLLLASQNAATGRVLYTWELTYPRFILAEVNTHRAASKNTASSRAIPSRKFRERVLHDPVVPISFPRNQRGMQGGEEITGWRRTAAESIWRAARYPNLAANWALDKIGVHKQVGNRLLEAHIWCVQCLSATDVNNLLALRTHKDAEPHFQALAQQMNEQVRYAHTRFSYARHRGVLRGEVSAPLSPYMNIGTVQILQPGEWHLPYVLPEEQHLSLEGRRQISMARCANTSYTTVGGGEPLDADRAAGVAEKLFGGDVLHLSPTEHPACAMEVDRYFGNFRSFMQYRQTIPNEDGGDRT